MRVITIDGEMAFESVLVSNYFITKTGKVFSIYIIGGHGRTDITSPHELKYGYDDDGYKRVVLSDNSNKKYVKVHTLVVEQFIGHIGNEMVVNHKDGDKQNNNVNNLEIITPKENTIHAHKTGLTTTERPVDVMFDNKVYHFRSIKDCISQFPEITNYYISQIRNHIVQFSMIEFRKLEPENRVSEIEAYYNGQPYMTFKDMKSAGLFFGKSKGAVSVAIKDTAYRKSINKYTITFPSVSTIEST